MQRSDPLTGEYSGEQIFFPNNESMSGVGYEPVSSPSSPSKETRIKVERQVEQVTHDNKNRHDQINQTVEAQLDKLPGVAREVVDYLKLKNRNGQATGFVEALTRHHSENFYDPKRPVSLHLHKSEPVLALQKKTKLNFEKQSTPKDHLVFPQTTKRMTSTSYRQNIENILRSDDPQMKDDLIVAEIANVGPMQGQLQIKFTKDIKKGTLIPWFGAVSLKSENVEQASLYIRQDRTNGTFEMAPAQTIDGKNAACFYTNDYAGPFPDRTKNKIKNSEMYNLEMVDVKDDYGTPYFFFMARRNVKKGEVGWTDYGDDYWTHFQEDLSGLSQTSQSCLSISNILALVEGRSTANPIDVSLRDPEKKQTIEDVGMSSSPPLKRQKICAASSSSVSTDATAERILQLQQKLQSAEDEVARLEERLQLQEEENNQRLQSAKDENARTWPDGWSDDELEDDRMSNCNRFIVHVSNRR